jgi:ubiquinol-cytochrome c reductase cytochrome b subunit
MAIAFIGYVLPWGQMSFWGATVITNLFSAIPGIGTELVYWLWGGFSVSNATLSRFFSLHYLLPIILTAIVIVHLFLLHSFGSTNPVGIGHNEKIPFYPYFFLKDALGLCTFLFFYTFFIFYWPNSLGHFDNYIEANPFVTPTHIVPEWYFLPFYAILRSIPNKLGGVLCMVLAILVLAILPIGDKERISIGPGFTLFSVYSFWIFVFNVTLLGWLGGMPVEDPFVLVGQVSTLLYFSYFFGITQFFSRLNRNSSLFIPISRPTL